jgi:hypothetical protein
VAALVRYWRAWALYGAALAGYGSIFFVQLPGSSVQPGDPGPASHFLTFASTLVGTSLLPGALGGPWRWWAVGYAQASPPAALQQLSWAVAAIVVLASCVYRVRAWRAWAILLGWIAAADVVPIVLGRLGTQPAELLGASTRYLTDATSVLALCLGLAFLPLAGEQAAYRLIRPAASRERTVPPEETAIPAGETVPPAEETAGWRTTVWSVRAVTLVLLAAFLAGSFWSLQSFEAVTTPAAARSYIATAQVAVRDAPRGTLIVDGPTPATIMDPGFFWRQGYTSQVIGAVARREPTRQLSWTRSPDGVIPSLMTFDSQGRLRPVTVEGPSSKALPRRQHCWALTAAGTRISLLGSLYRWPWTARLEYSGPATVLAVRFGGDWQDVAVPTGRHAVYVPVVGAGSALSVRLIGAGAGACLASVTVGSLHPQPAGPAIPATPVHG